MFTDFQNSFTAGLSRKFAVTQYLKIPPRLNRVATLPCEISMFGNRDAQRVSTAECCLRLRHSKNCFKIGYLSDEISSMLFRNIYRIKNRMTHGTQLLQQRKRCRSKMPYMISSRSVAVPVSRCQSVSMSKLVCRIFISVDNKGK